MTNLTFTTKDTKEFETTSFESTITGSSKPTTTNGSSEATELLMTTEEIQLEVTTEVQNHNWTCPSRFGLFSDESDCNKFYHCSHWKPFLKKCPSNLHFNSVLQVCDWPEHAGCDSLTTSTSIRYSDTTNDKASETSPFEKFTTDSIEQNNVTDKSNKSETTMSNSEETTTSYGETATTSEKETTSSNGESTTPNGDTTTTSNGETTTTSNGEKTTSIEERTTSNVETTTFSEEKTKTNEETTTTNEETTTAEKGATTSNGETTTSDGKTTTFDGETATMSHRETTTTADGNIIITAARETTSNGETTTTSGRETTTTTGKETTSTSGRETTTSNVATAQTTSNREIISTADRDIIITADKETATETDRETSTMSEREATTTADRDIIITGGKVTTITADRQTTSNGGTTTSNGGTATTADRETTSNFEKTTTTDRERTMSNVETAATTSDREITTTADRDVITMDRDIIITDSDIRITADRETTTSNVETAATTSDRETTTTADRDVIITADRQTTSKGETTTSKGEIATTTDGETTTSKGGTETSNGESTTSTNVKTTSDVETTSNEETTTSDVETTSNEETTTSIVETTTSNVETTTSNVETTTSNVETTTSNVETTASNVETTTSNVETTTSNVETTTSNVETSSNGEPTTNVETTASNAEPTTKVEITTANEVTTSISEVTASKETTTLNQSTTITENSSNEFTETYKDEKTHSIVPEIATTRITSSNDSMKFECLNRFGLYPDPESCTKFYHCSHWIGYHKTCPSDLHFNPVLQVCDWPYRAGCGISPVVSTSEPILPKEDDIISNQTCDCECCFYTNKTDCSKYTLCLGGVLHRGQCAEGLLFNHVDHNCDIADRVTCLQSSASCTTQNGVFPHPVLCSAFYKCFNGQPTLESCPEDKHFKASEGKCVDPCDANCNKTLSCSTPSPPSEVSTSPICIENDGLYPSENDCSSYYQCAEGHPYFVKCPDGLHFNAEYGVCERPCDARCDPTIDCPSPIQLANSKSLDIVGSQCPIPNGLFPAAQDCSAYYLCFKGKSYLQHCPPGLHYSTEHETCETPCNAHCVKNIDCSVLKGVRPKENLLKRSSFLPLWLICKTLNNEKLANPTNCTSFYKCSDGKPHLLPCPRGLHFDPEDRECKDPCLAGCDSSIKCPSEIPVHKGKCSCENCYQQDPTDCSAYLFCSQGLLAKGYCPPGTLFDRSSSECRNSSEVVCEAVGDPGMCREKSGNFPYPGDCHRFVRCEDSVAHIVDCEEGLEFDPEIRACANPKGYCDQIVKDPLCEGTAGQFAHPSNRSFFYQCENGVKYLKACSPPLVYNTLDQVCDWPHNTQDKSAKEVLKNQDINHDKNQNNMTSSSGYAGGQLCHEVPGVTCPCACRVTTYDGCDSFYHCRGDGKACRRHCPQGLYFNRQTMVCDLPQNVECRDFFFATLKRLKYRESKRTWLKYPLQSVQSSAEFKF